ncbi:MAG: ATP-binding protein [Acidobacteriota bacterium]
MTAPLSSGRRRGGLRARLTLAFALSSGIPLAIILALALPFAGRQYEKGLRQEIERAAQDADATLARVPRDVTAAIGELISYEPVADDLKRDPADLLRMVSRETPHLRFGLDHVFFIGRDGRYLANSLEVGNTGVPTPEEQADFDKALDGKESVRWVRPGPAGVPIVYALGARDVDGIRVVGARAFGAAFLGDLRRQHKTISYVIVPAAGSPLRNAIRAGDDTAPLGATDAEVEERYFRRAIDLTHAGSRVVLLLLESKAELASFRRLMLGLSGAYLGAAIALSIVVGYVLSRRITDPIARLVDALAEVAGGNLDVRISVPEGAEEIARLEEAFNRMASDLKENKQKLLRAERVAAWQEIARRLAHGIKNPLSPIRLAIENCRKAYDRKMPEFDEIFREASDAVLEEVEKLRRIVEEFSQFARLPKPMMTLCDLNDVARGVLKLHAGAASRVALREDLDATLPSFFFDQDQVHRVLVNLVQNAIDVSPSGGDVVVATRRMGEEGRALLTVTDHGPGVDPEIRDRLFAPYFTTKAHGTGLGLAISARIVEEHGGSIAAAPAQPGTTFTVSLPLRAVPPNATPTEIPRLP